MRNLTTIPNMNVLHLVSMDLLKSPKAAKRTIWSDTPLFELSTLAPRTKGARFEAIAKDVLTKLGYTVTKATNSDHDVLIDGVKTEIKGSMINKENKTFSFMQIRPDYDYEQLLFLCIRPDGVRLFYISKKAIQKAIESGQIRAQHGGQSRNSGTFCFYGEEKDLMRIGALPYVKTSYIDDR